MRWDNLFDDLESHLEHELGADDRDMAAEEERLRLGRLSMRERLGAIAASEGRRSPYAIRVQLVDGSYLDLRPILFGRDWCSAEVVGEPASVPQVIVPIASISSIVLSRRQVRQSLTAVPERESESPLAARLGLGYVVRDLCRRRTTVEIVMLGGALAGTVDRVGRDHLDLAVHEPGSARRQSAVMEHRVVPFAQILFVRVG